MSDKREREESVSSEISDTTYKCKKQQKKHRVDVVEPTGELKKALQKKEEKEVALKALKEKKAATEAAAAAAAIAEQKAKGTAAKLNSMNNNANKKAPLTLNNTPSNGSTRTVFQNSDFIDFSDKNKGKNNSNNNGAAASSSSHHAALAATAAMRNGAVPLGAVGGGNVKLNRKERRAKLFGHVLENKKKSVFDTDSDEEDEESKKKKDEAAAKAEKEKKDGEDAKKDGDENAVKKAAAYSTPAPVAASTAVIPTTDGSITFASMGLIKPLLDAVNALGYANPSPIQQQAIPNVLAGKDVFACAQTGTGKTAAFVLPIIHCLYKKYVESGNRPSSTAMKALILTPTRELAAQINDHIWALCRNGPLSRDAEIAPMFTSTVIVGGVNTHPQIKALQTRPAFVIATPGRLLDLRKLRKAVVDFSAIEFCVLDEADRMLDMGFYKDVSAILADVPAYKQTMLFSATFTKPIRQIANQIMRVGEIAEVQAVPPSLDRIKQSYYLVSRDKKDEALKWLIEKDNWFQVLVFTRTQAGADAVTAKLNKWGISALSIHGGKTQNSRIESLKNFKTGKLRVLVATDIAARGIDIADLPHVINYELPSVGKDYVHRVGRTGRAGKEGIAISLVNVDEESILENIQRFAFKQSEMCDIPMNDDLPAELQPTENEEPLPVAAGQNNIHGAYGGGGGAYSAGGYAGLTSKKDKDSGKDSYGGARRDGGGGYGKKRY